MTRVLVTGGSGFLGRVLVPTLADAGYQVVAPSRLDLDMSAPESCNVIRDLAPDVVVHLAAFCGGIGLNRRQPDVMLELNTTYGLYAINGASKANARLVLLGSVCSYPKHCPVPFKESDLWNGYPEETNAPYGIAKRWTFEMASCFHRLYGLRSTCLLPANLYGPGDHFDDLEGSHVIPAMIRKFTDAKEADAPTVTLWGSGKVSREFLYVEDCAAAIVKSLEYDTSPEPINIGTGVETRIDELADCIKALMGYQGRIIWDKSKPDGQPRRCLDTMRAKALLGWQATTSLVDGLRKTIQSYHEQRSVLAAT